MGMVYDVYVYAMCGVSKRHVVILFERDCPEFISSFEVVSKGLEVYARKWNKFSSFPTSPSRIYTALAHTHTPVRTDTAPRQVRMVVLFPLLHDGRCGAQTSSGFWLSVALARSTLGTFILRASSCFERQTTQSLLFIRVVVVVVPERSLCTMMTQKWYKLIIISPVVSCHATWR